MRPARRYQVDLPDIDKAIELADWIEVLMLQARKPQLSRARLIDDLAGRLSCSAQELEMPVSIALGEVTRRRRIAGSGYPLLTEGSVIKLDATPASEFYRFLLLVSLDGPMRKGSRFREIDQTFDNVVREAVSRYLGPGTETIRFGWPVSEGRPTNFNDALDWLSERLGLPVGIGKPPPHTKDGGLDVVAWKPFRDKRAAYALLLVQCTVQTDWHPKSKDIMDHVWLSRIDSGRPVVICLAVPFVIPRNYPRWDELRRMTNIVFDRLRLTEVLANSDPSSIREMISWSDLEMTRLAI